MSSVYDDSLSSTQRGDTEQPAKCLPDYPDDAQAEKSQSHENGTANLKGFCGFHTHKLALLAVIILVTVDLFTEGPPLFIDRHVLVPLVPVDDTMKPAWHPAVFGLLSMVMRPSRRVTQIDEGE